MDEETAWAQGTHEYRPMGAAVVGVNCMFCARDFKLRRNAPARYDSRFTGHFASLGQMNDFLSTFRNRSQAVQKTLKKTKSLAAPYF